MRGSSAHLAVPYVETQLVKPLTKGLALAVKQIDFTLSKPTYLIAIDASRGAPLGLCDRFRMGATSPD